MDVNDMEFEEDVKYTVVYVTVANKDDGLKLARTLLAEKLAACVNIIDGVTSVFNWKGKVEQDTECLLIIKTRLLLMPDLIRKVKELHSYDVPEIIALPIVDGNQAYLSWIDEVT